MMDDESPAHLQELLRIKQERLRVRQEQKARFGYNTSPEIVNEIADIEREIEQLRQRLALLSVIPQLTEAPSAPAQGSVLPRIARPNTRSRNKNYARARASIRKAERSIHTGNISDALKALASALRLPDMKEAKRRVASLIEDPTLTLGERLRAARLAADSGDIRPGVCTLKPEWCDPFPEGYYDIGIQTKLLTPQSVWMKKFAIARYPVTVAQFRKFKEAHGYEEDRWWTKEGWKWVWDTLELGEQRPITQPKDWDNKGWNAPNQPALGLSWYEAMAFCKWLTERGHSDTPPWLTDDEVIRLPSEAEWEVAARYDPHTREPKIWAPLKAQEWQNSVERWSTPAQSRTTPVGIFPQGISPCGAYDMAGNVLEWCGSYYYSDFIHSEELLEDIKPILNDNVEEGMVLRGGSYAEESEHSDWSTRFWDYPETQRYDAGFRLCKSTHPVKAQSHYIKTIQPGELRFLTRTEEYPMDTEERAHIETLRKEYRRRLQQLEQQQARKGIDTEPHIITEIEDIRSNISLLEARLDRAQAMTVKLVTYTATGESDATIKVLDWSGYFSPSLPSSEVWQTVLLPQLHEFWQTLAATNTRAITLHAKAHLSAGFAFGYIFRATTGFRLWIEQPIDGYPTQWWSTDEAATPGPVPLIQTESNEDITSTGNDTLFEINVSRETQTAVAQWLSRNPHTFAKRVIFRPPDGPGKISVRDSAHAMAMVRQIEAVLLQVRAEHPKATIHLFAALPIGLAVLLGTRLNRCGPIQCYEYANNSYLPSCLLG